MRPQLNLRARSVIAALGAVGTSYVLIADSPLSARAANAGTPAAVATQLTARLGARVLRYRQRVVVLGRLLAGQAGTPVALEYQAAGAPAWTQVATAATRTGGAYRLSAALPESGVVRVALGTAGSTAAVPAGVRAVAPTRAPSLSSDALAVRVRADLAVRRRNLDVLAGNRATLHGVLRPARAHRVVALQVRAGNHWVMVARNRTGVRGGYRLAYTPQAIGRRRVRLAFGGDGLNAGSWRSLGWLNAYRLAGASWYGGGGGLACGGQLTDSTLGVANKTLPCGTIVTLRYNGRSVRVPVIDRGPYVAGREFDLTVATKNALGFGDTGDVWTMA